MEENTTLNADAQLPPLAGEAARQAMDSMAGYDYQILRTVEAWLQLGGDGKIYIECAEDYDVMRPDGAVTTQVKNSPTNITLNSADVREAIRNFWELTERNAGRERIDMRFLTRGAVGKEQMSALGESGILVWRKAAAGDDVAAMLVRNHILGQGGSDTFLNFLQTADAKRLREELLSRIEWVTGEPSAEAVRLAVNRLAINMGRSAMIPPGICVSAVPGLLDHCRQAAIKKEPELRSLTFADAQIVFEQYTSVPVSITQTLANSMGMVMAVSTGGSQTPIAFTAVFDLELPELPVECMPRAQFISNLRSELLAKGALLVVGTEGEGKSTAANLVARMFSSPFWLDLRGGDEVIAAAAIENAIVHARSGKSVHCLVLDDVPADQGVPDVLWGRLKILIDSCRRAAIPLVMTSKGVPADAVDPRFQTAGAPTVRVPRISEPELISYLEQIGCSDQRSEGWARITLAHTGGHPKLVHLAALELRDHAWTAASTPEFFAVPSTVQGARVAARQRASKNVPLPDRELLFALALTTSPFKRDVALQLATRLHIDEPGAVFDRLDGRWVERIGKTLYRATPLLDGQTREVWAVEKVRQTHGLFYDAYMATKTISVQDAMTLTMHAWQSHDGKRLSGFLASLSMSIESTEGLPEALELLVHFGAEDGVRAIDFDPLASLLVRSLQFRIARARRPEMLPDMARRWLWEINQESNPLAQNLFLGMRGMCIALAIEGAFSASVVVEGLQHVALLEQLLEAGGMGDLRNDALDGQDLLGSLFLVAQSNFRSREQVSDMLSTLENAPPGIRARLLKAFEMSLLRDGMGMFDRALVTEYQSQTPDWAEFSNVLIRGVALAQQWKADACEECAARVLSIVYSEHLDDEESARRVLKDTGGVERLMLKEQEANLAYGRKDYVEAIRIWDGCLWGSSLGEKGIRNPFALRKAGIACAKLGRYADAARWFERAALLVDAGEADVMPSALFRIDASQCWFRAGVHADALRELGLAWCSVNHLIDAQKEPQLYAAQRFLGNLASWMANTFDPRDQAQAVMWIGGASRPDLDINAVQAEPPTQLDVLAFALVRVCSLAGVGMPGLAEAIELAEMSKEPMLSAMCRMAQIGMLVREGKFAEVGSQVRRLLDDVAHHQVLRADGDARLSDQMKQVASYAFACSLSLATLDGGEPSALMNAWEASLSRPSGNQLALSLAKEAADKFDVSPVSAMDLVRTAPGWLDRIGAASVAIASDGLSPLEAAQAQWVLAYHLTDLGGRAMLHVDLGRLADEFSRDWQRRLASPALLTSPRVSVPLLKAAIMESGAPAKRILALAMASAQACGSSVPAPMLTALRAAAAAADEAQMQLRSVGEVLPT
ncbi:hypothetical protein [Delftia sp. WSY_7]|uniref:hypothetical protein n=1 Tax=Delftia sp. WSY_7 TaxID=3367202 RepID=UPI00370BBD16